ncbi:hypothetical protein Hanom_Chr12g01161101 [Helianthus anomalus]
MGYTQRTRQSLKLSRTRPTTKEKSLQSFKRAQEKILNGLLVFYKKNGTSFLFQHVRKHQGGYDTLSICEYDENASTGNYVPVSEEQQDSNAFALRNEYTHHNLEADLVEYIWNNAQNEPAHHMEDED